MTLLNDWKEILKVQIVNTKQGIKTSQRKLPIDEDEDCYPPLLNLFSKWAKLLSNFDPSSTLVLNFEHGLSPKELCDLKNNSTLGINYGRAIYTDINFDISFAMEITLNNPAPESNLGILFEAIAYSIQRTKNGKRYIESIISHQITIFNVDSKQIYNKFVDDYVFDTNAEVGKDIDLYIRDFRSWEKEVEKYISTSQKVDSEEYLDAVLDLPLWYGRKYEDGYSSAEEL